jgi:two-component system nitrogen regulation response regulator NtrX
MNHILVVDDEADIRKLLEEILREEEYAVASTGTAAEALVLLRDVSYDVMLLDIWLPDRDGLDVLNEIRSLETDNKPEVIIISGHGTIETAVRATKLGAFDFLEKPLSLERTLIVVKNAIEAKRLRDENREFQRQLAFHTPITGESVAAKALRQQIKLMAPTNGRVLIFGESGSGKELIARAIHAESQRRERVFVELNCAAIPEDYIESELFGYRNNAVPGGPPEKRGTFERADGGTLFLDEVGDMSLKTQAKVLSALDEQLFTPVGGTQPIRVDVRVIAATNVDVNAEAAAGRFRQDLLFRLNTIEIHLPPLRERREDIELLAHHFLRNYAQRYRKSISGFDAVATQILHEHPWPGNVRELDHAIERGVLLATGPQVKAADLGLRAASGAAAKLEEMSLDDVEHHLIQRTLSRYDGNVSQAAKALGLSRSAMYRRLQKHGLE